MDVDELRGQRVDARLAGEGLVERARGPVDDLAGRLGGGLHLRRSERETHLGIERTQGERRRRRAARLIGGGGLRRQREHERAVGDAMKRRSRSARCFPEGLEPALDVRAPTRDHDGANALLARRERARDDMHPRLRVADALDGAELSQNGVAVAQARARVFRQHACDEAS